MDLLQKTKELCRLYNITPARTKGQNFLIKEEIYDKIIEAAELKKDDTVLEVGPGLGFLTAKLAARVKKVIAVELDDKLAKVLNSHLVATEPPSGSIFKGIKNVEVVNENILEFSIFNYQFSNNFQFPISNFKIVANLPYNITSIFFKKFLSTEHKPSLMVLMLQKEVAERIAARPGKMSLLAVSVQFYAKPEILEIVPRNNFWPAPEVDSAIIKLEVRSKKLGVHPVKSQSRESEIGASLDSEAFNRVNEKEFFRLVKIGFSARRKMLKNNLANGYHISHKEAENWLKKAGFDLKIRAQELSVADWLEILEMERGNVV